MNQKLALYGKYVIVLLIQSSLIQIMKPQDLIDYTSRSKTASEVFNHIIKNSDTPINIAGLKTDGHTIGSMSISIAKQTVNQIQSNTNNVTIQDDLEFLKSITFDDFKAYVDELDVIKKSTLQHKLFVAPFKKFWLKFLAGIYSLNANKIIENYNSQEYIDIGEGLFYGKVYLFMTSK